MIIVGTYLDRVTEQKARELEKVAMDMYSDSKIYPKVLAIIIAMYLQLL